MENSSNSENSVPEASKSSPRTATTPRKGYPRKRSPIPEHQLEKDRQLSRKLYRIIYALPFLVVAIAFFLYLVTR